MDTGIDRNRQHLPVRVAAALLHMRVVGAPPDARDAAGMRATLNDVARALALVAPIYCHDPASGAPVKIPESQLIGANFTGGGDVLVATDGTQYRGLTVIRADLETAGEILGGSGSIHRRWTDRHA